MQTYGAIMDESMATRRFTLLLAVFAATALVLAIVGLYGALSYAVSQRQREIDVRVALGAASRDISRLVVSQGMRPAVVGLAAGLALSLAAGRLLETMIYGVSTTDAMTFGGVLTVVGASTLAACLVPARRAAGIEPAVALRAE
jgi:ABC-type antimicrobial peptide transport system permease subunit